MESLHPKAKWIFRKNYYFLSFFIMVVVIFLIYGAISGIGNSEGGVSGGMITTIIVVGIILWILIGEIYASLAYKNWKYEFTESALKIENGIIFKTYKSIPYQRIQNVDIHRGILARMFGFSTLDIQTAGYSGGYNYNRGSILTGMSELAEGHIPAVSMEAAEKVRDWIMEKIVDKRSGI